MQFEVESREETEGVWYTFANKTGLNEVRYQTRHRAQAPSNGLPGFDIEKIEEALIHC